MMKDMDKMSHKMPKGKGKKGGKGKSKGHMMPDRKGHPQGGRMPICKG